MWNTEEVHFDGDYLFQGQALATASAGVTSGVFNLGETEGGIRVHGYTDGDLTCASGNTFTVALQTADSPTATSWTTLATQTATATATKFNGDIFSFVPDKGAGLYMRAVLTNTTSATGKVTVAVELIP